MKITVKVFATLRKEHPNEQQIILQAGSNAIDVIKYLKINKDDVSIIMVNGRRVQNDRTLNEDDTVALFPPVGGG